MFKELLNEQEYKLAQQIAKLKTQKNLSALVSVLFNAIAKLVANEVTLKDIAKALENEFGRKIPYESFFRVYKRLNNIQYTQHIQQQTYTIKNKTDNKIDIANNKEKDVNEIIANINDNNNIKENIINTQRKRKKYRTVPDYPTERIDCNDIELTERQEKILKELKKKYYLNPNKPPEKATMLGSLLQEDIDLMIKEHIPLCKIISLEEIFKNYLTYSFEHLYGYKIKKNDDGFKF